VSVLEDTITYLEMLERPAGRLVPAPLDRLALMRAEACTVSFYRYFGLIPDFIGRRLGPYLLQAAIDRAWSRPIDRFWLHTSTFDHPKALRVYQRAGFVVYARRAVLFEDPRERGILPRTLGHRLRLPTA